VQEANIEMSDALVAKSISTHQYMSAKWPSVGTTHVIHSGRLGLALLDGGGEWLQVKEKFVTEE
jgi:hypothetical protein